MEELHPEVTWKVPSLFANDRVALALARSLAPELERPLFQIAYGAPASAWSGGRPCRVGKRLSEDELRSYFDAYGELGIRCALTFTWPDVTGRLDDAYANLLLALIDEYGGQAIVADDRLCAHIRRTHPSVELVASNNVCVRAFWDGFWGMGEADYYRRLLETYDEVVVRTESVLGGDLVCEMTDIAGRCEVIVNQHCAWECELAPEHIRLNERNIAQGLTQTVVCPWRRQNGEPRDCGRATTFVSEARRTHLVDRGFTTWKLGGRNRGSREFVQRLLLAVFGKAGAREVLLRGDAPWQAS